MAFCAFEWLVMFLAAMGLCLSCCFVCLCAADPAVSEVGQFLRSLRMEAAEYVATVAVESLPSSNGAVTVTTVDSPFETALLKVLSTSDAFVVHWLLRQM